MKTPPIVLLTVLVFQFISCSKEETKIVENFNDTPQDEVPVPASEEASARAFEIKNGTILHNNKSIQPKGVNALNSFGIAKDGKMAEWNIAFVREFIGNLGEQPISGWAIQDAKGQYLHSLDSIVVEHRKNKRITILCPFGWVDANGNQTLFTGKNPREMPFYADYKVKLNAIADFFKGQEDVWIEVWNEPYHYNNENNYSHEMWLADHEDMIENLRTIDGFDNIIVVPGNEQGQGEDVLLEKGQGLLEKYSNILFDLHAYGKWHDNTTLEDLVARLTKLQQKQMPVIFGEVGVITEGAPLSNPTNFLTACDRLEIGALAWLWNRNTQDQNSLLTDDGEPNITNNMNWGPTFKTFLSSN